MGEVRARGGCCNGHALRRRRRRRAAVDEVLRQQVPKRAEHREGRDGAGRGGGAPDGRLHPPHVLPRRLRQRVRRVHLARRHGQLHRREERRAERQLGARVRGDRRHQDPGRGVLQRHRLLRRHPRPRRARRRQPAGRADVDGAAGSARRADGEPERGEQQPAGAGVRPRHPRHHVRQQGALAAGLSPRDMTALSGAHTLGQARCVTFRSRIYNDGNIDAAFAALRQQTCPQSGGDATLAPIDVQTPDAFDNAYYANLVKKQGLFHSDQELFNGGSQDALVKKYAGNSGMFAADFAKAMVRMGALLPAAGTPTEVRLNCRKVN